MSDFDITAQQYADYNANYSEWCKWRLTYEGGQCFIDEYLQQLSSRETAAEFAVRKSISYCPAFSAAAVDEVKDSIFQRATDITRTGGSDTYQAAVNGSNGGVDLCGSSMNSFLGREILPELLTMSRVGIMVDMPILSEGLTLAETQSKRPYIYIYKVEDIINWVYDESPNFNEFSRLLLRDRVPVYDTITGLEIGNAEQYKLFIKDGNLVRVVVYDKESKVVSETVLSIPKIPFVMAEISHSLLTNVANYQIGLLNIASSDMNYCFKANFPFYTEQQDPMANSEWLKKPKNTKDGTAEGSTPATVQEIKVGTTAGRKYPKNLERPAFIHPSSEPLMASIAKQEQMKKEIRELVKLAVSTLQPKMASEESKKMDYQSLESGLSYIGLEAEHCERQIAQFWSLFENSKIATVKYPQKYSLKSDSERREESESLLKLRGAVPSKKYQKEISKLMAGITIGHKLSNEEMVEIFEEIDKAEGVEWDYQIIASDLEAGIVSRELASKLRGYPEGEWKKAEADHIKKLEAVAKAQSQAKNEVRGATQSKETAKGEKELIEEGQKTGATEGNRMGGSDDKS